MKRFLGAVVSDHNVKITIGDDAAALLCSSSARVSPLFPAFGVGPDPELPNQGYVAFLFPRSPRAVLTTIANEFAEDVTARIFVTHGLASVVVIDSERQAVGAVITAVASHLYAYEVWPVNSGVVERSAIEVALTQSGAQGSRGIPSLVNDDNLPYEAASQVRQFNANLMYFWQRSSPYCPEYEDLTEWLCEAVRDITEMIREIDAKATDDVAVPPRLHHDISLLVDINSTLTILNSQLVAATPPILESGYPVGEYSLLGIGSATRATWRLYAHIARVFTAADHVGRLQRAGRTAAFDAGLRPYRQDRESWSKSLGRLDEVQISGDASGRRHIVHFSSRWGFHETLHAMSISWQCIHASASREWNLLTLSHEYLHSHFRDIVDSVMNQQSPQDLLDLVDAANSGEPDNFLRSMQCFIVQQLRWAQHADELARSLAKGERLTVLRGERLNAAGLQELVRRHMHLVEHIVVHVMDYFYFYDTDDDAYVSSLWHSWALVPSVNSQLSHYVLRTLFAISAISDTDDSSLAFTDAADRLERVFDELLQDQPNTLIERALEIVRAPSAPDTRESLSRRELRLRFRASYDLVRFTTLFLIDQSIHSALVKDGQAIADADRRYEFDPGYYPDETIESPVGFLFDRFPRLSVRGSTGDVEYESLWQMLVLVE